MKTIRETLRPRENKRRGAVIPLAAILLVALLAMVAFTVDIGYIVHVRTELQRTADACAFAAVRVLPDKNAAQTVALSLAEQNFGTEGPVLSPSDVVFGFWDRDTGTFDASSGTVNAVSITMRRTQVQGNPLNLFFAPVIGNSQADVQATSIAMYDNSLCGPLVGIDWISIPGEPTTDSYRSGDGPYAAQVPRDNGNICSDGPIALDGQPVINGDAHPGSNDEVLVSGSGIVTGSTTPRLRPLNIPGVDDTAIAADNDNATLPGIQKGNSITPVPDANGNFLVDGGKTYNMPPGEYYFNDFSLTGSSTLNIDGPTIIYITGNLDTAGGSIFNNTQIPSNLQIYMTGGNGRLTAKVDFYGTIYAPNTHLLVDGGGQFFGAAVGKTLTLTGTGDVHYDENLDITGEVPLPKRVSLVE